MINDLTQLLTIVFLSKININASSRNASSVTTQKVEVLFANDIKGQSFYLNY